MFLPRGLVVLACHAVLAYGTPATYDQRQTGDLNVQIHLKDVRVVALLDSEILDDYTDYDYFYDYADFTVRPTGKPTTSSTTSVQSGGSSTSAPSSGSTDKTDVTEPLDSSSQNSTEGTLISQTSGENVTLEVPSIIDGNRTDETSSVNSTDAAELSSALNESSEVKNVPVNDGNSLSPSSNAVAPFAKRPTLQMSRKRCRSGFSSDGKGRCRRLNRRRISFIPLALKLAPKLLKNVS